MPHITIYSGSKHDFKNDNEDNNAVGIVIKDENNGIKGSLKNNYMETLKKPPKKSFGNIQNDKYSAAIEMKSYDFKNMINIYGLYKNNMIKPHLEKKKKLNPESMPKTLVIPSDCEEIEDDTFSSEKGLIYTKILFDEASKLKKIGKNSFKNQSIEEISLPDNIEEIGENAFEGCNKMKKIKLSKNLKKIKKNAFFDCQALSSIIFTGENGSKGVEIETDDVQLLNSKHLVELVTNGKKEESSLQINIRPIKKETEDINILPENKEGRNNKKPIVRGIIKKSNLEGGFYYIESSDKKNYTPVYIQDVLKNNINKKIQIITYEILDIMTIWQFGTPIKIIDYYIYENNVKKPSIAEWKVKYLNGKKPPGKISADKIPTLHFDFSENKISGSGGCNSFFSSFKLNATNIEFGPIASTKIACLEDEVSQFENLYFKTLSNITEWEEEETCSGKQLILISNIGSTIFFAESID